MFGSTFGGGFAADQAASEVDGSTLTALDRLINTAASDAGVGSAEAVSVATVRGPAGGSIPPCWPELAPAAGCTGAGVSAKPPQLPIRNPPSSVGDLASSVAPPKGFTELMLWLGAESGSSLEEFCLIPETDFMDALGGLEVDEIALTSMRRASLIKYLRAAFEGMGFDPPAFGSAQATPKQTAPPPQAVPPPQASQPASFQEIPAGAVNLHEVVDQKLKAQAPMVSFSELGALRDAYEKKTGAPPQRNTYRQESSSAHCERSFSRGGCPSSTLAFGRFLARASPSSGGLKRRSSHMESSSRARSTAPLPSQSGRPRGDCFRWR